MSDDTRRGDGLALAALAVAVAAVALTAVRSAVLPIAPLVSATLGLPNGGMWTLVVLGSTAITVLGAAAVVLALVAIRRTDRRVTAGIAAGVGIAIVVGAIAGAVVSAVAAMLG